MKRWVIISMLVVSFSFIKPETTVKTPSRAFFSSLLGLNFHESALAFKEQKYSEAEKIQLLKASGFKDLPYEHSVNELSFYDFDNDGDDDLFCTGFCGGAADPLMIAWEYDSGEFKQVFNAYNYCVYLSENEIWMQENDIFDLREYSFNKWRIKNDKSVIVESHIYHPLLEFPLSKTMKKKFKIDKETYNVRLTPKIDNETAFDLELTGQIGNVYFSVEKGKIGEAFASTKDDTGRIWWFVHFEEEQNTYKYGWISSRYVTEL